MRLDAIDKRLDAVDRRFDSIDHRLDGMDRKFEELPTKSDLKVFMEEMAAQVKTAFSALWAFHHSETFTAGALKAAAPTPCRVIRCG